MNKLIKILMTVWVTSATLLTIGGCLPEAEPFDGIRLSGSSDMSVLTSKINNEISIDPVLASVKMEPSANSISELKQGKYDAVLLGREPTTEELKGLRDYVIAYDAVCIIIDENSYYGGTYNEKGGGVCRTSGIRELSSSDLKEIFSFKSGSRWLWYGEYYTRDSGFDRNSWLFNTDYGWIKDTASVLCSFIFPPGKFDTQTVLYQNLELDEKAVTSQFNEYPINEALSMEEEVLSYQYDRSYYYAKKYGNQNYIFQLGFASRRVMTIATKHAPVKALAIEGINPMEDTESIYDGRYIFSRKIHLLMPDNGNPDVLQLAEFLVSQEGQDLITNVGYLPLPVSQ
jgi:hypothetical protein